MSLESKLNNALAGLPLVLANAAVNWTLENYKKQQWNGTAWPGRKRETKKSRGRQLLVQSGRLRRGIQVVGDNSFGVLGVPYARIHNEGGSISQSGRSNNYVQNRYKRGANKGKFKKGKLAPSGSGAGGRFSFGDRNINIPQRKFIGNSPQLRQHLIETAKAHIKSKL